MIINGVEQVRYTGDKLHIMANKEDLLIEAYKKLNKQGKRVINTSENMTYTGILSNWIWEATITWEQDTESDLYKAEQKKLENDKKKEALDNVINSFSLDKENKKISDLQYAIDGKMESEIKRIKDNHTSKRIILITLDIICVIVFILSFVSCTKQLNDSYHNNVDQGNVVLSTLSFFAVVGLSLDVWITRDEAEEEIEKRFGKIMDMSKEELSKELEKQKKSRTRKINQHNKDIADRKKMD